MVRKIERFRRPAGRGIGALVVILGLSMAAPVVQPAGAAAFIGAHRSGPPLVASRRAKIEVVAAENEYANVAAQIGGAYVTAVGIMSNPNTDPHTFEASPGVAREVSSARLVVQNGVGYDAFMTTIERADASSTRVVINVQKLRGLPTSTANPHLWYTPATMPAVAKAMADDLGKIDPSHATYFTGREQTFVSSLKKWHRAIASLKSRYGGDTVATTEPVADYLLAAAGLKNETPWSLQADIMNGVDPSPQDISAQEALFSDHKVKVFVYNQQVTDTVTDRFLTLAEANHIPVVGVYETMPEPGYDYQSWMQAEVHALTLALSHGTSSAKL